MNLYAKYLKEHHGDDVVSTEHGFAVYRYLEPATVYIVDIYVLPDFRKSNEASRMADQIVEIAKQRGCTKLLGTVVPAAKNSNDSVNVLLRYGMTLSHIDGGLVVFQKEI